MILFYYVIQRENKLVQCESALSHWTSKLSADTLIGDFMGIFYSIVEKKGSQVAHKGHIVFFGHACNPVGTEHELDHLLIEVFFVE